MSLIKDSKPLKTDKTTTKAKVPTAIPNIEIAVIILTAFLRLVENKYRLAM